MKSLKPRLKCTSTSLWFRTHLDQAGIPIKVLTRRERKESVRYAQIMARRRKWVVFRMNRLKRDIAVRDVTDLKVRDTTPAVAL